MQDTARHEKLCTSIDLTLQSVQEAKAGEHYTLPEAMKELRAVIIPDDCVLHAQRQANYWAMELVLQRTSPHWENEVTVDVHTMALQVYHKVVHATEAVYPPIDTPHTREDMIMQVSSLVHVLFVVLKAKFMWLSCAQRTKRSSSLLLPDYLGW